MSDLIFSMKVTQGQSLLRVVQLITTDLFIFLCAAILLGSIKVSYEEIRLRILRVDEEKLTVQMIEQLIKDMPEPEQMGMLADLKSEYHMLAEPEQFGVVVSTSMV